jgi:hypothetical protein
VTLAGSIKAALSSEWALTGDLAKTEIRFADSGWFDREYASDPQVVVSELAEPIGRFFGTIMHSYPRYLVNCWLPIPQGNNGTAEAQQIEDMRYEVTRIVWAKRADISPLTMIVPQDHGIPRHELDGTPRILRYEITLIGVQDK